MNKNTKRKTFPFNFAITNARSVVQKLESVGDSFTELDLSFMIITETWLWDGPSLDRAKDYLTNGNKIEFLHKGRGSRGGGLAILSRKSKIVLREYKTKTKGHEILIARGKIQNNSRPLFIIAAYIKPSLTKRKKEELISLVVEAITKIKSENPNPYICIAGDFNRTPTSEIEDLFHDINLADTPPTRGDARLDIALTNFNDQISSSSANTYLTSNTGQKSDHATLLIECQLTHTHQFKWVRYKTRIVSDEAKERFTGFFSAIDWEKTIGNITCPHESTRVLHEKIETLNNICFPWKSRKVKSTDKPWITDNIKRKIRRRKRRYKKHDRDLRWEELKRDTEEEVRKGKKEFYDKETDKLMQAGSGAIPYNILHHITDPEAPPQWSINNIDPTKSDEELGEIMADYFTRITDEFEPIDMSSLPSTFSSPIPPVTPMDCAERIKNGKKPLSPVQRDILPSLLTPLADLAAIPAARIINISFMTNTWPKPWRLETQSLIPKSNNPTTLDELRNISCTNYLSKIMESFLIEKLQKEVKLKYNQFGGIKKTGTIHFLIEAYQRIVDCLENEGSAVTMLSIDFSKAFNRMCHNTCISELAARGASSEAIGMVAAFLNERSMRIKINNTYSANRRVLGGSPQGTKIGNFLFTVSVEAIEEKGRFLHNEVPPQIKQTEPETTTRPRRFASLPINRFNSNEFNSKSTPIKAGTSDGVLRYLDESGRGDEEAEPAQTIPQSNIDEQNSWTLKYVDDMNVGEEIKIETGVRLLTTSKEKRLVHAPLCEEGFYTVKENANNIGMKVNDSKTQLLCLSAHYHLDINSYIRIDGEETVGGDELKILGFVFDKKIGMEAHVRHITRKFGMKSWAIRHLKKAGVEEDKLVKIYCSLIRSVIEYAAQLYHYALTATQAERLEHLQRIILKTIYGFGTSYREALQRSGLDRLSERRQQLCKSFAKKAEMNPRYSHWFPLNHSIDYDLRRTKKYKEELATTERRKNSPIFRMRRILNEE